jgi:hypothetical protein
MAIIHVIHPGVIQPGKLYEKRIVTLNSTYPWNYVSLSKPLMLRAISCPFSLKISLILLCSGHGTRATNVYNVDEFSQTSTNRVENMLEDIETIC